MGIFIKNKNKKQNKQMREKVTMGKFFRVQLKIINELYQKYKLQTTIIIVFSMLIYSAEIIELKFLEYVTNNVSSYMQTHDARGSGFSEIAISIALFMLALLIIKILSCIYDRVNIKYQSNIVFESQKKFINKLSEISYEYFESNVFYEKINLASQANGQYANAVYGITQIFKIMLMTVGYGILLARLSPIYIIVVFTAIIISIIVSAITTDKQLDYWRTHVSPESRSNEYFKSVMNNRVNHQNIQTKQAYSFFSDKHSYYNGRVRKNYLKLNLLSFFTEFGTVLMFAVTFMFTALVVGKGVVEGRYEIGYFSMVMALLISFFSSVKSFSVFMLNGNWYVKVLNAYYEVLSFKSFNENNGNGENDEHIYSLCSSPESLIEFRSVKYKYAQSDEYALNGIDISFRRGEKIAVIGHNGCGKTTMISIILRLLKNIDGDCAINENSVCTAVMQDFGKYQMTVKENIEAGCGGKSLPEQKISDVLRKVGLYERIMQLENGIYTQLGQLENGVELSQGEWQRIAICRLLVNEQADIWVLDEPAAYLDPIAEVEIYKLIFSLAGNRLVFFISHRMGFAKMADRIIVMEKGKIKESGSHAELMKKHGGLYAAMYEAQKEWYS